MTLTAGSGALTLVRFGQMVNARVSIPGTGQQVTSNQEIKPPPGATTFTFDVLVDPAVQSGGTPPRTTVPMTVFDGCGTDQPWNTFVGGGATALQSTASIEDAQVSEGNSGNTQVTFTIKLSVPSSQPVTYTYNTSNGTAAAPSDFVAATGTVTFNPGETQKNVVVQVRGDFDDESDEAFTIALSNPVNGGLGRSTATARIVNDDAGPSASGDTYVATIGQQLSVAAPGVLSNDQNGSQPVQVVSFGDLDAGGTVTSNAAGSTRTLAPGGSLTVRANGSFDFTPPTNAGPSFSFRYRAESLSGQSDATVIVNIQTGPAANADPNYVAIASTPLNVPEGTGVLANDTRGAPAANVASFGIASPTTTAAGTALDLGNGGSLNVQANGSFSFVAPSTVTGPFTFQYRLTNIAGSSDATVTITVARGPVITTTSGSTAFAEGSSPVLVDPDVTITNPSGGNVTSATVVIANPLDGASEALAASVPAGGITSSYSAATHTLTLTGPASAADFQTVLRGITYANTSSGPNPTARTIQFEGVANAQTGNQATKTVTVASVNDAPVLANIEPASLTYNENDPPISVTTSVTISDVDSANLTEATVGITGGTCVAGQDVLSFTTQNGITGTYTPATCTLVLAGSSSVANYETALRSVQYSNSSNSPTVTARTVGFQVTDGVNPSNTVSRGINIGSSNDLPVVTTTAGATQFAEAGGAVTVDSGITVADQDHLQLATATVTISNLLDAGQETLAATTAGTSITANYVAPTLTLTGPDTLANYQQVLASVTYNNASFAPTVTDRTITFVANDGVGNSAPATKTVTISASNSAPAITTTSTVTSFTENGPAVQVESLLTVSDADSANLASATVTITNIQDATFETLTATTAGTSITANYVAPTLTLSGADTVANYQQVLRSVSYVNTSNNPTTFPDRVIRFRANDGAALNNLSNEADKSVSVTAADDLPTAVDDVATVLEDSAATAVDVLANDTDVDGGPLAITTVQNPSPNGGTVLITGGGTGLTYQPAADYCNDPPGSTRDTVTYTLNGGSDGTLSVTVTCVNDEPSFLMGPNQGPVDNQDAGGAAIPRTVNNWATLISKGAANESTQNLTFTVSVPPAQQSLFTVQPAISADGALTYTPNTATAGTATVSVSLQDDGGTANGGDDSFTPTPNTFTIQTIFPAPDAVDDGPSADYTANGGIPIDIPASIGVTDNDLLRGATITGYGAPTGAEQTTIGTSTATAQGGTVTLNADGSFRYTPPCSVPGGSDTFKYQLTNLGGSDTATVTITVNAGVCFVQHSAAGGGNGSITAPFQQLGNVPGTRPNNGAVYVIQSATPSNGSITLKTGEFLLGQGVAASGNLPFTPAVRSDLTGLPAAGNTPTLHTSTGNLITLGTGNTLKGLTVGNHGDGNAAIVDQAGGFGTLTVGTGVSIETSQRALVLTNGGTFAAGSALTEVTAISVATAGPKIHFVNVNGTVDLGTGALQGASGAGTSTIVVNGGNVSVTYSGDVTHGSVSATGALLAVSNGHTGTLTFQTGTLAASAGSGLQFDNADGAYNFNGAVTLTNSGASAGIDIMNGSAGTFSFSAATSITHVGGNAITISGGSGDIDYNGTITKTNAGRAVDITGRTGTSTISFDGAISCTFSCTGISLTSNSATTTTDFTGLLTLSTGASAAFSASSAGMVTAPTASNTLVTTTASALNVSDTTIGAAGLTFLSINSTGGSNPGIVLRNTGSSGGLTVTGAGGGNCKTTVGDCTGGSITNKIGASESTGTPGIRLHNVSNVRLQSMNISGNNHAGIYGGTVDSGSGAIDPATINGFQLTNSRVTGNGDSNVSNPDEAGVILYNLVGTSAGGSNPTSITDNTISNNFEFEVQITNSTGTLSNLQMSGNAISANGTQPNHGNLVNFLASGGSTANMTVNVTSGTFTGNTDTSGGKIITATGMQCDHSGNSGTMTCNISGSTFTNNNVGPQASVAGGAHIVFDFNGNDIQGSRSHGVNVFADANAPFTKSITGRIRGNTIGTVGDSGSASEVGFPIRVQNEGRIPATIAITGNIVSESLGFTGINVNHGISTVAGSGATNVTITGNTVRNVNSGRAVLVQQLDHLPAGGNAGTVCADISGNTFTGIAGQAGDGTSIRIRRSDNSAAAVFNVRQATPTGAAVPTELDDANGVPLAQISIGGTPTFNGGTCAQPSN